MVNSLGLVAYGWGLDGTMVPITPIEDMVKPWNIPYEEKNLSKPWDDTQLIPSRYSTYGVCKLRCGINGITL